MDTNPLLRRYAFLLLLPILTAGNSGCETAANAPDNESPKQYEIAFVSGSSVYVCRQDGSGKRRVSGSYPAVGRPSWSSDGQSIAFLASTVGQHLFVANRTSDDPRPVMSSVYIEPSPLSPIWSPDGRQVATTRVIPRSGTYPAYSIVAYSLSDSSLRTISPDSTQTVYLAWSPDGGRIACMAFDGPDLKLSVVNASGTGFQRLSQRRAGGTPQWSPDGQKILFHSESQIASITPATGADVLITNSAGSEPRWSPSGDKILFSKGGDLWIMVSDGSLQQNLTQSANRTEASGSWSPDGNYIAFSANDSLFTMVLGTKAVTFVTAVSDETTTPAWSPLPLP